MHTNDIVLCTEGFWGNLVFVTLEAFDDDFLDVHSPSPEVGVRAGNKRSKIFSAKPCRLEPSAPS